MTWVYWRVRETEEGTCDDLHRKWYGELPCGEQSVSFFVNCELTRGSTDLRTDDLIGMIKFHKFYASNFFKGPTSNGRNEGQVNPQNFTIHKRSRTRAIIEVK